MLTVAQDPVSAPAIKIRKLVHPLKNKPEFFPGCVGLAASAKTLQPLLESVDNGLRYGFTGCVNDLAGQTFRFGVFDMDRHT